MTYIPVIAEHIEITPGICGGKPRITGHRIRVEDIVIWHERMGLSPEEIVDRHPTLSDIYTVSEEFFQTVKSSPLVVVSPLF